MQEFSLTTDDRRPTTGWRLLTSAGEASGECDGAALVVALWGVLDAAPFLCALVALALLAEWAADFFDRVDFWKQAVLLEIGLLVYSFFVSYGADAPVLGIPARLWSAAVVLGGAADLSAAVIAAYEAVNKIYFEGMRYRRDIGARGLLTAPVKGEAPATP